MNVTRSLEHEVMKTPAIHEHQASNEPRANRSTSHVAIFRHSAAHFRQTSAHRFIIESEPAMLSQLSAHASQTAAHAVQVFPCWSEPRAMKAALVAQIPAQSARSVMCARDACSPPNSRQCAWVSEHVRAQSVQADIQLSIMADFAGCGILVSPGGGRSNVAVGFMGHKTCPCHQADV